MRALTRRRSLLALAALVVVLAGVAGAAAALHGHCTVAPDHHCWPAVVAPASLPVSPHRGRLEPPDLHAVVPIVVYPLLKVPLASRPAR